MAWKSSTYKSGYYKEVGIIYKVQKCQKYTQQRQNSNAADQHCVWWKCAKGQLFHTLVKDKLLPYSTYISKEKPTNHLNRICFKGLSENTRFWTQIRSLNQAKQFVILRTCSSLHSSSLNKEWVINKTRQGVLQERNNPWSSQTLLNTQK